MNCSAMHIFFFSGYKSFDFETNIGGGDHEIHFQLHQDKLWCVVLSLFSWLPPKRHVSYQHGAEMDICFVERADISAKSEINLSVQWRALILLICKTLGLAW